MNYTQWYAQHGKFEKHEMWLKDNLLLETIMGSHAYGCETITSDYDICAIVMPKREHIYPTEFGFIVGFDQLPNFKRKELKGKDRVEIGDREVEAEWLSLVEFFVHAGLKGSPNLIEVLFTRRNSVTVGTRTGWMLRDNRHLFLSKQTFEAFKGYAHGQMHRIRSRKAETDTRLKMIETFGYDVKMAYHTLRLLDQIDQLLTVGEIDLMRNKEECKAMRRGEWGNFDKFEETFQKRMVTVEDTARKSPLAPKPQLAKLHNLLLECIEHEFGSEEKAMRETEYVSANDLKDEFVAVVNRLENIEKLLKK